MNRMVRYLIRILLVTVLIVMPGCENKETTAPEQNENPTKNTAKMGPDLVYRHPDMEKVETEKDVVYKTDNGKELKMDIYYPLGNKDASKAHTVVLVHGKAPIQSLKDTELYNSWGRVIAANGFSTVTFNWRPSVSPDDVSDLIEYIRDNSAELGINGHSISIFAFSAGVKEGVAQAVQVNTGFIDSIVVYYGEIDKSILNNDPRIDLPPMFIAMAQNDDIIPAGINEDFIAQAKASGCEITYTVHSRGRHGFEVYNDDEETYSIIEKTIDFIGEHAKN